MKSEPPASEEFRKFKSLLTGLMAVPHSELKEKMAEYDREKEERQKKKRRAKKPAASRAAIDRKR